MNNLLKQIEGLVIEVPSASKLNDVKVIEYYANKKDSNDTIKTLEEAFEKGLNLANYEKQTVSITPKNELMIAIFGAADYELTSNDIKVAKKFNEILAKLIVKPRTPFQIDKAAAQAKIQNVKKGANKSLTLEQAFEELLAVYTKYGETYVPRIKN